MDEDNVDLYEDLTMPTSLHPENNNQGTIG